MKTQNHNRVNGMLTETMDVGTRGFYAFQSMLLDKAKHRSQLQKKMIALLGIQYEMEDYINSDQTDIKAAGGFLKSILNALRIPQNRFANYVGLKPSNLSKLIKGERSINYDLALIFGKLFNHNPMLWIEIQAKNEIKKLVRAQGSKYRDYSLTDLISESIG